MCVARNFSWTDNWVDASGLGDRARHTPKGIGSACESEKNHKGIDRHRENFVVIVPNRDGMKQILWSERVLNICNIDKGLKRTVKERKEVRKLELHERMERL